MKKVMYFCDKCKELIATQRLAIGFQEEKHLLPMGEHEWCQGCVQEFRQSLIESPNVNDIEYEHGK